jgi:rubredoxin
MALAARPAPLSRLSSPPVHASEHRTASAPARAMAFVPGPSAFSPTASSLLAPAHIAGVRGGPPSAAGRRVAARRPAPVVMHAAQPGPGPGGRKDGARVIGLVGRVTVTRDVVTEEVVVPSGGAGGLFGVQAKAYWESMGVLPLSIAAFGVAALALKLAKVMKGEWRAGNGGVNRATTHESIVTTEEEEAELHVFKCGGCGYEMYPARGREFKFFPDSFKCPLCQTPKDGFWDLNDPTDPRNQEDDDDDADSDADGELDAGADAVVDLEVQVDAAADASPSDIVGGSDGDNDDEGGDGIGSVGSGFGGNDGGGDATAVSAGGDDGSSATQTTG